MPWVNHYRHFLTLYSSLSKRLTLSKRIYQLNLYLLGTQSLQPLPDLPNPLLHFLSAANHWEDSAARSEQREDEREEVERGDCRRAKLVMSGFMAGETAAGGGRIDGWHIISFLIAAPQNWIASRGLWSVRIWLMSPTPLLSPDSSPLSGPGLGFLSFSLTAIPPSLHSLPPPCCLYLDSVSGEEATKGVLTRSVRPLLPASFSLSGAILASLYLFQQYFLKYHTKVTTK